MFKSKVLTRIMMDAAACAAIADPFSNGFTDITDSKFTLSAKEITEKRPKGLKSLAVVIPNGMSFIHGLLH